MTPIHQFTHTGDKVLLLRSGTIGCGGFQWPESGKVICPKAQANREQAATPDCESGGLFGWPWGIGIGDGKTPDFTKDWIVFAANPEDVIQVGHKAKAIGECKVIYCGPWHKCFKIVEEGKLAWLKARKKNLATSKPYSTAAKSGYHSTAATSGNCSIAATSGNWSTAATSGTNSTATTNGESSTAATSGNDSTAATSGAYSTATTSGYCSKAATSGKKSTATTSGDYSTAATSGDYSTAATSGYCSKATTSGRWSISATSGRRSTAATSGYESTAATSGDNSTATTSGPSSIAAASGNYATAKALGKNSAAVAVGTYPTVEVAEGSVGLVIAENFTWHAHPGATVVQKWNYEPAVLLTWNRPSQIVFVKKGKFSDGW